MQHVFWIYGIRLLFYVLKIAHHFSCEAPLFTAEVLVIAPASQEYKGCITHKDFFVILFLWVRVCTYICVVCACILPMKVRSGHCVPWTWSCRWVWVTTWVLGTELRSSAGEASAPVCWAISPVLSCIIFDMGIQYYISFREGWIYKNILFSHQYVALHLRGSETGENDWVFSWKPLLPDREVLHQGTILAYLHFHFSRVSV